MLLALPPKLSHSSLTIRVTVVPANRRHVTRGDTLGHSRGAPPAPRINPHTACDQYVRSDVLPAVRQSVVSNLRAAGCAFPFPLFQWEFTFLRRNGLLTPPSSDGDGRWNLSKGAYGYKVLRATFVTVLRKLKCLLLLYLQRTDRAERLD